MELGQLLKPDLEELIQAKEWDTLRETLSELDPSDRAEVLQCITLQDSAIVFRILPRELAAETFEYVPLELQTSLIETLGDEQIHRVVDEMAPDDRTRLLEELPAAVTRRILQTLSPDQRKIARRLLGYPEDSAGRMMTPEYVAVRPDITVAEALAVIREQAPKRETINVIYVVDTRGRLLDDIELSTLVLSDPGALIQDLDDGQLVKLEATATREEVVSLFKKYDRLALPVTDTGGEILGIITFDDVQDVQAEVAAEDIQKMGGMEAVEAPIFDISLWIMVQKRAPALAVLLLGETLTASAMSSYEHEIERAQVLALFVPLIISAGGNSGSQATSLIIQSFAKEELTLRDWWRVFGREIRTGVSLGVILGIIGAARILLWPGREQLYTVHYKLVAGTIALSLVGVVLFGSVTGSMLPFLLRRLRLDPATASAPLVATVCDVMGLVFYFSIASAVLRGSLL
ncbi:MAG: magnesium transporter [Polyangiales bacterium]